MQAEEEWFVLGLGISCFENKKMKFPNECFIFNLGFFLTTTICAAQLGIGNENPTGLLDVNDSQNGNATAGLVIPSTSDPTSLKNPQTGKPSQVPGTIAFDSTEGCIKFIRNSGVWSECLIVEIKKDRFLDLKTEYPKDTLN